MNTDYVVMTAAGDTCPTCGAELELLVDLEDKFAPVIAERCPADPDHLDNIFVTGAEWPNE